MADQAVVGIISKLFLASLIVGLFTIQLQAEVAQISNTPRRFDVNNISRLEALSDIQQRSQLAPTPRPVFEEKPSTPAGIVERTSVKAPEKYNPRPIK